MNRIERQFARLREAGRKALVVYIGAGDPDLAATERLAIGFERAGVDVLELGVPFSDPLADGLVNQLAAQRGLASGTTPARVLETVAAIRRQSEIPIVLYIYYNLVHRRGVEAFTAACASAGVDGLLVLDLPPEEAEGYGQSMARQGLCPVFLIAPTTPEDRVAAIVCQGRGFIYYVSREGVTGMQDRVAANLAERLQVLRRHTPLPIAVGFGVSNPDQARRVAREADGVVVGSAVVDRIAQVGSRGEAGIPAVIEFVRSLAEAVHGV